MKRGVNIVIKIKNIILMAFVLIACSFSSARAANHVCTQIKPIKITERDLDCLNIIALAEIDVVNTHFDYICLARHTYRRNICQWSVPIYLSQKDLVCISKTTHNQIKKFNAVRSKICSIA